MRRVLEATVVAAAGIGLVLARPGWDGTIEDRVVATCWLAAAGLWAWLTVVGALHAWATRTGRRRLRRLSGALLPVVIRRRVEQLALAGLLVVPVAACADGGAEPPAPRLVLEETTPLEGPAGTPAATAPTTTTTLPPSTAPPTTAAASTTTLPPPDTAPPTTAAATTTTLPPPSTPPPTTAPATTLAPPSPPPPAAGPGGATDPDGPDPAADPEFSVPVEAGTRVVVRGDSLWSIAADHVAAASGDPEDAGRIHRYWAALVEENRATLASGDPDVIYPGEAVRLPPVQP